MVVYVGSTISIDSGRFRLMDIGTICYKVGGGYGLT